MLAVKTYLQSYINQCRTHMDAQLTAYSALVGASGASNGFERARATFEPQFLANLTVVLSSYFMHRTRAIEGKDGNPLNEVRMLSESILAGSPTLVADSTIKYKAENSVLKLSIGDPITLDIAQFRQLNDAFFTELEAKFT